MMTIFNSSRTGSSDSSKICLEAKHLLLLLLLDCLSLTLSQTLGPTNWLDIYDILPD